jgi:PD-(D/E)XK nuclease superfamily
VHSPNVDWPLARNTISPSALKEYQQCPESFRRKYVHDQWDRSSWSSVTGNAVHRAQEINLGLKIVTGTDVSEDEIDDLYRDSFHREVADAGGVEEIDWWKANGDLIPPSQAIDMGAKVNRLYHRQIAPTLRPLALEQWFTIRVPGVIPAIRGRIDLLELHGGKIDWKFGGMAVSKPRKDWVLQAEIYNLADDTPFAWHSCSWDGKICTPINSPELMIRSTPERKRATEMTVRSLVRGIVAHYHEFGPDDPWPGTGKTHTFACDYCSFHPDKGGNCPYWPQTFEPQPLRIYTESTLI